MTSIDGSPYKRLITSSIFGTVALLALIFIPVGTLHYWQGWAVAIVASGGYTFYLAKHDPALLKRRSEAGISHEKEPAQKVIITFLFTAFIALIVLPPLDVRFGWSAVPWFVSIREFIGLVVGAAAWPLTARAQGKKIFLLASPSPSPPPPPDQSTVWGVWCEVWGPVFGHRAAWLPRDDAPAIFATRDEAEAEAERPQFRFRQQQQGGVSLLRKANRG
jgi:hypothetical protein